MRKCGGRAPVPAGSGEVWKETSKFTFGSGLQAPPSTCTGIRGKKKKGGNRDALFIGENYL